MLSWPCLKRLLKRVSDARRNSPPRRPNEGPANDRGEPHSPRIRRGDPKHSTIESHRLLKPPAKKASMYHTI
ncbi:Hypothetical protein NTJ_07971 [Nesidiocoris tenuis]|uniref:Uncharacterized protein n=1 Tax=Nesidiocoris tenuis TaxID=355587 RepID=A0ABN7AUV0_9HEMI|nr:Hypothetical protein NTJ_07971 [Nesidiocoris tenuis]